MVLFECSVFHNKAVSPTLFALFYSHLFLSKMLFPTKRKSKTLNTNPMPNSVLTFVHRDVLSSLFYCALLLFFFFFF